MEKIVWTDRVRDEVLYGDKGERKKLHVVKREEGELDWSYLA